MMRWVALALGLVAALACVSVAACSGDSVGRPEGLDPTRVPVDARSDYDVFAHRCSKCHSLARAWNSGIDDDAYWAKYVERMRRQPASGISHEDARVILRFLSAYSREQRRTKAKTQQELEHATSIDDGGAQ
jgi:hypothetical protein